MLWKLTFDVMVLLNKYKRADNWMHWVPLYINAFVIFLLFLSNSYDSEGRLMNVTFPTGMVNNLYTDIYSALTVDIESSMTEEEISITTNTSTIRAFYTLAQGKAAAGARLPRLRQLFCKRLFVIVSGVAGAMLSKLKSCIITA